MYKATILPLHFILYEDRDYETERERDIRVFCDVFFLQTTQFPHVPQQLPMPRAEPSISERERESGFPSEVNDGNRSVSNSSCVTGLSSPPPILAHCKFFLQKRVLVR
jgi:hypothetical protein